jgi:Tol biopolymer transport system component
MGVTLAWSSDGKFIAVPYSEPPDAPAKILLVSPETFAKHALTNPPAESAGDWDPMFSPDNQSVAFFRINTVTPHSADIYTVPISGGEPRRLTFDNAFVSGLDWTPDGREIIFGSNRTDSASAPDAFGLWRADASGLWRISAFGGTPERISLNADHVWRPRIARQGNRLTYVQIPPANPNIYAIKISNETASKDLPTKLIASTQFDAGPQFSPDGRRITFHSDRSGNLEIWICDSDGTNLMELTSFGANKRAGSPRWSPDGHQIAFDVFEKGKGDVYVINVDDRVTRPIAMEVSTDHLPSWSRDGKWIYFASDRSGRYEVWKTSAHGGQTLQVTTRGGFLAFESFDGTYLYYIKPFPTQGIWRVPVNGGEEVRILDSFESGLPGDWALSNDGIYFIHVDGERVISIQFFDFSSRKTKLVASLGKIRVEALGIAVAPDGRQILYTQDDQNSTDITLVENFR